MSRRPSAFRPVTLAGLLTAAAGAIGVATVAAGAAYATAVEPCWLEAKEVMLASPRLPRAFDGLTVLHVSDTHVIPRNRYGRMLVERAVRIPADVVCMTGDFADRARFAVLAAEALASAKGRLGTFAVLGNHDVDATARNGPHVFSADLGHRVAAALEAKAITVLRNRAARLERDGSRLWIVGVDDPHTFHDDVERAYRCVPPGEPSIFLAHSWEPTPRAAEHGALLALAGHTHGGQVRPPFFESPAANTHRRPPRVAGLSCVDGMPLHISQGLGQSHQLRFLVRPQVVRFRLRTAVDQSAGSGRACCQAGWTAVRL